MLTRATDIPELRGSTPTLAGIRDNFDSLAKSRAPVLICGERGTGKEEVARALHRHNGGTLRAFVVAEAGEPAAGGLEDRLFGDAAAFARASKGTVFFDEIGNLSPALQTAVLRVLQSGAFSASGRKTPIKTGARIMAATTQDLHARARAGLFSTALLARFSEHTLRLPPLRERRSDIPELVAYYLMLEANELSIVSKTVNAAALEKLCAMAWPGNLPQLESVCRRITAFATAREIDVADLPGELAGQPGRATEAWGGPLKAWAHDALATGQTGLLNTVTAEVERILIRVALDKTGGQRQEAARLLGWGRNTLTRKIRDLQLDADED